MRYETTDLHEVAYLVTEGARLVGAWEEEREVVSFGVEGECLEKMLMDYRRGMASTNVKEFIECVNRVKDLMFSVIRTRRIQEMRIERRSKYARERAGSLSA